ADHDIDVAVVVEVTPGGTGGAGERFGQVAALGGDIGEVALAVVAKQLAAVSLRNQQIKLAVVIEVAEGGRHLAGLVGNAAVPHLDETAWGAEGEDACAGAVEEIGAAVAVDVGDGQRVTLDIAADAVGAETDLDGNVLEP